MKGLAEMEEINVILDKEENERKKNEDAMKLSEEILRSLIKQCMDGILVLESDTLKIIEGNDAICKIFKYTKVELLELKIDDLIPNCRGKILAAVNDIVEKRKTIIKETTKHITRDNNTQFIEMTISLVEYNNKRFIILTIADITERLISAEKEQQNNNMESLGSLAEGVAHDFNNILAGIIGYTQITIENEDIGKSNVENLLEILKLGERAKRLISQMLTFTRKTVIEPSLVDIKKVIEEILTTYKLSISDSIIIQTDIECQSAYVLADPNEIHQLIINLVNNAEMAMCKNGGCLRVELKNELIQHEREINYNLLTPGNYIVLNVIDNGCGMDESVKKRIFEPFFTTRKGHGSSGLGLSVVHGIISRYKGAVAVNSYKNKGSAFTIYLPSAQNYSNSKSCIKYVNDDILGYVLTK